MKLLIKMQQTNSDWITKQITNDEQKKKWKKIPITWKWILSDTRGSVVCPVCRRLSDAFKWDWTRSVRQIWFILFRRSTMEFTLECQFGVLTDFLTDFFADERPAIRPADWKRMCWVQIVIIGYANGHPSDHHEFRQQNAFDLGERLCCVISKFNWMFHQKTAND